MTGILSKRSPAQYTYWLQRPPAPAPACPPIAPRPCRPPPRSPLCGRVGLGGGSAADGPAPPGRCHGTLATAAPDFQPRSGHRGHPPFRGR